MRDRDVNILTLANHPKTFVPLMHTQLQVVRVTPHLLGYFAVAFYGLVVSYCRFLVIYSPDKHPKICIEGYHLHDNAVSG